MADNSQLNYSQPPFVGVVFGVNCELVPFLDGGQRHSDFRLGRSCQELDPRLVQVRLIQTSSRFQLQTKPYSFF